MFPTDDRRKGATALGATQHGEAGPFGPYDDGDGCPPDWARCTVDRCACGAVVHTHPDLQDPPRPIVLDRYADPALPGPAPAALWYFLLEGYAVMANAGPLPHTGGRTAFRRHECRAAHAGGHDL